MEIIFQSNKIKKIIDYCNLKKLEILSVGYNNWANNNINLDPFEYLKEIRTKNHFYLHVSWSSVCS